MKTGLKKRRAIFLDRDGVINRSIIRNGKPYPPLSIDQVEILPGVEMALSQLQSAGFLLIVVTNQPDVARGSVTEDEVQEINQLLARQLPIDSFRVCFHDDRDNCNCRKPMPGLLLDACREYDIDIGVSYMIGDRWRDVEAGNNAGCKSIYINYNYDEKRPSHFYFQVNSLVEAVDIILREC